MIRAVCWLFLVSAPVHAGTTDSPNGRIAFEIFLDNGQPRYEVAVNGETLIAPSRLGLKFKSADDLADGFERLDHTTSVHLGRWQQPWGEDRTVISHYTEGVYRLRAKDAAMTVRVRVYDDGLGFRYELEQHGGSRTLAIMDELTEFRFAGDGTAFWQTGDGDLKYEHLYVETPLADVATAHTPVTVRLDSGLHVSVHEAALVDYAAYRLKTTGDKTFVTALRPWSDGVAVHAELPFETPWRTLQITDTATGLLNSRLILDLNEPNQLGDVSWVEPGKYAGIWWEIHRDFGTWGVGPRHAATTDAAKAKIDFASKYKFDGVLVEGWNLGWDEDWVGKPVLSFTDAASDFDLPAVANYARENGVRLVGHHETGGFASRYEREMAAAFRLLAALGVRQVKTGYVGPSGSLKRDAADGSTVLEYHDGQFAVRHHQRVIEEAAKHRISINTHEPVKATGLRRTYPNWISREGARGQEFNIWGETDNPPEHEVMLVYTRLLAGPMDFTPGVFDLQYSARGKAHAIGSTLAKQLALYVCLYSPIQMVPDLEAHYDRFADAFQFIVDVPTDWERSIAVDGEVGDYVVYARKVRGGDDWFIGAITDESARDVAIAFDFLGAKRTYTATVYRDGADAHWLNDPYDYRIETLTVTRGDVLSLRLAPGGGAAIRLTPTTETTTF